MLWLWIPVLLIVALSAGEVRTDRLTLFAMVVCVTAALVLLPPWGLMTRQ